ncbi:sensor histidine kinase [Emticicia fontis]
MSNQNIYIRIIFFSSLSIASIYLVLSVIRNDNLHYYNIMIDFVRIFGFSVCFWLINLQLFNYLSKRTTQQIAYLLIILITSILAYYIMVFLAKYLSILYELKGIKQSGIGFRGVVANLLIITFLYSTNIFRKYKEVEAENERLKRNQLENQLLQLKAQLNPHFLFNSFSTLKAMVEEKDENSVEYIIKLSEVYRYLIENAESHLVTIREELKMANAYFFMLKSRFEENINLEINLGQEEFERKIPSMSLQLLIENAVKHNVISRAKPLTIKISAEQNYLIVQNNFQPKRNLEESTKIGLKNLDNRCHILVGKSLYIRQSETDFLVKIPIL